ncbi:MAG: hypothetical protein CM1200mP41_13580 [Gammaproteobacteria bacterium]|nr:MAG: hypothetical protein CM1200mP41_13580 [Gammaproteobacteria bacterium]
MRVIWLPGRSGGGRLPTDRCQNVDFELSDCRCVRGLGERPWQCDPRLYPEKGMNGLSTPKIEGKFSLRASVTGEIVMEMFSFRIISYWLASRGSKGHLDVLIVPVRGSPGAVWVRLNLLAAARSYTLDEVNLVDRCRQSVGAEEIG